MNRKIVLISDKSWEASQDGPIRFNDTMQGEIYDSTLENIDNWHEVTERDFGYANLVCSNSYNVREHERFVGTIIQKDEEKFVIDFGQNIAGYVEFKFEAKKGQKIKIRHGECLENDGTFTIENFQAPNHRIEQFVEYICKEGWNVYKPEKTFFGFRYIEVTTDLKLTEDNFTAIAVYSDMKQTSYFETAHEGVNKLFKNAVWSMKGNFLEVPTDCPTREKSGFTGDAQLFVNMGMFLMDCYPVYRKFLDELRAVNLEGGCISQIAPTAEGHMFDGSAGWSDAIDLIPWRMYLKYENTDLLIENYQKIKEWLLFSLDRAKTENPERVKEKKEKYSTFLLDTGHHWGEWVEPDWNGFADKDNPIGWYLYDIYTNGSPEITNPHLSYGCFIASEIAKMLHNEKDYLFFKKMHKYTKLAYREVCLENGRLKKKRQCNYIHAIFLGC